MSTSNDLPIEPKRQQPVPALGERRRRRQLDELLQRRDQLGAAAMQRMCHGLPEDGAALAELVGLEASLAHCWPEVYKRDNVEWLQRDARRVHDPDSGPDPSCIYCQAARTQQAVPHRSAA